MANAKSYVIVRHAPGGQELIWKGTRKKLLERKRSVHAYGDSGAWFEVREATENDNLTAVPGVQVVRPVILNRQ